jgi:hypothetical protein
MVVTVSDTMALGIAGSGLGDKQVGRSVVTCVELTVQVNETGPLNVGFVGDGFRAMVAVAWPPGSTPAEGENADGVSVKFCPWANVP